MAAAVSALHGCKLAVIMGTASYGKDTGCPFGSRQELTLVIHQKPFFSVKICDTSLFNPGGNIANYSWRPSTEAEKQAPPVEMVDKIVNCLSRLQRCNVRQF